MGKLFDSMKPRGAALPLPTQVPSPPRLQVVPQDLAPVDDHEPMPFYEVPNELDPARVTRTRPSITLPTKPVGPPVEVKAVASKPVDLVINRVEEPKVRFTPAEPRDRGPLVHFADELVVVHQPDSNSAREYRDIAERLIHELGELRAQSLTLLPLQQNSSSILAANLGSAWAEVTRHPLVMVDAARTSPGDDVACLFGLTNSPGWEELMTGSSLGESLQQTGRAWLDLIGSGRRLAWSNTQAWAERADQVLQSLEKHYKHVVLLGPAFPFSPLGLVLAETTDSTCILASTEESQLTHRETILHTLGQQGRPVVGTILLDS